MSIDNDMNFVLFYMVTCYTVERGLMELRKLGIETQLWEESRKELELDTNRKLQSQSDF